MQSGSVSAKMSVTMAVVSSIALALISQTAIGLLATYHANATDTLGLGWVVLLSWAVIAGILVVLLATALRMRYVLPAAVVVSFLSLGLYVLLGVQLFGWTGLLK